MFSRQPSSAAQSRPRNASHIASVSRPVCRFLQKKFEPDKPYMTNYLGHNITIYDMKSGSPVYYEREKQDDKIVSDGVGEIVEKLFNDLMRKIRKY